jgi:hypothetical protein
MPAATWASRPAFKTDHGRVDPEDPQKGRFGGKAEAKGRKLSATVGPSPDIDGWFVIDIKVTSTSGRPLRGKVDLWVHDSFPQEHYWSRVRNGEARFTFSAYGAFTIGATCDGGRTALELDLSTIPKAPREFREN